MECNIHAPLILSLKELSVDWF